MNSHFIAKKSKSFSKKTFFLLTTQECVAFDDAYKDFPQRSLQSSRGSDKSHMKKDQLIMGPIKTGCWLPGTRVGQHIRQVPLGFPGGAVVENLPANAGDTGSSPGLGRSHMPRSD